MKVVIGVAIAFICVCAFAEIEWQKHEANDGAYSILMPKGQIMESVIRKKEADVSDSIDIHVTQRNYDSVAFIVTYADYPAELVKDNEAEMIKNVLSGIVSESGGKVTSETIVTVKGIYGKEMRVNVSDDSPYKARSIRARCFLAANRLFQIAAIGPGDKAFSGEYERFFTSFNPAFNTITNK